MIPNPAPGESARVIATVPGIEPQWPIPVTVVRGLGDGPRLTVTAGIHAAEYPGIAAAIRLGREINPENLQGTLVIAAPVNLPGFYERAVYVNPIDGQNINRVFPGRPDGSPAERVAHFLMTEVIAGSDAFVDLHGGDMVEALVPFALYMTLGGNDVERRSREIAGAYDLDYIIAGPPGTVSGAAYAAAASAGIPAVIAEVGQQGIYDQVSVARHLHGLRNVLIRLGMLTGVVERKVRPTYLSGSKWLHTDRDATYHPFVEVGEQVEEGQTIGELRDLFGETLQVLKAPATGPVLFLVTALAVKKGDPLIGIGIAT
ncbi:MAG: succinylglutamate desuccinylase/aspartoacylase family protein [bacterium]